MGRQFEDSGGGGGGGTTAQSARELVSGESKRTNFDSSFSNHLSPFLCLYMWAIFAFIRNGGAKENRSTFLLPFPILRLLLFSPFLIFPGRKKVWREGQRNARTILTHTKKGENYFVSCWERFLPPSFFYISPEKRGGNQRAIITFPKKIFATRNERKRRRKEEEEQGLFSFIPFLAEKDFSISSCGKTEKTKGKKMSDLSTSLDLAHILSPTGENSLIREI